MTSLERAFGLEWARAARSVQVGTLWHEATNIENILHRYCKHIFTINDNKDYPHSFPGSASAIRIANRHFLFCCGHQIHGWNPDQIAFCLYKSQTIISPSRLMVPIITDNNHDVDYVDTRAFEYTVKNYGLDNLASEFFPLDQDRIWPYNTIGAPFLVYGYPTQLQDVDYARPNVAAHAVEVKATYEGGTSSPHLHRIRMDRGRRFDADGMSGGPVFYIGRDSNSYFIGWAGMIMRGSVSSDLLHFLAANFLIEMAFHFPIEEIVTDGMVEVRPE